MELMQRRRELMAMQTRKLDTSPKIIEGGYGKRWSRSSGGILVDDTGCNATILYDVGVSNVARYLAYDGLYSQVIVWKDGAYIDYWSIGNNPRINANANQIAVTIPKSRMDTCYLYIKELGEIIFAGKDTIYYGHRNISELN